MKTAISVSDMAAMVGLSRARFYQLIGKAFPWPLYDVQTRRPFYSLELQQLCVDVRQRNCGIDGRPVIFYSKRPASAKPSAGTNNHTAKPKAQHEDLIEAMKGLGLSVSPSQVDTAVKELFPEGLGQADPGQVVRSLFLHLRRVNQSQDDFPVQRERRASSTE